MNHIILDCAAIEDDYTGPKLEDGKVTLKFMKEMMDWFKDQKKLHRKCAYQVTIVIYMTYSRVRQGNGNMCMLQIKLVCMYVCISFFPQILVQVKDVLSKLPSLVEITLKEVRIFLHILKNEVKFFSSQIMSTKLERGHIL